MTANKNNVTKRSDVNRPLTYVEGDTNFEELKNVITDQQSFESQQNTRNTTYETDISDLRTDVDTDSQNLLGHENAVDPHPQYATDTKVDGIDTRVGTLETSVSDIESGTTDLTVTSETGTENISDALNKRVEKGEVGAEMVTTATGTQTVTQALDQRGPVFDSVADMKAATGLTVGIKCRTLGYYTPGDGGGNDYEIVASLTGTDDGGSFIDLPGSGLQASGLHGFTLNVKQYGAKGGYDIETQIGDDDTAAFNRVWEITQESSQTILAPTGATLGGFSVLTYLQEYTIVIPRDTYYVDNVNWRDNFKNRNIFVYGNGSTVCGRTPGGAIINTGDSRWIHAKDLVIYGLPPLTVTDDPTQESYCGLYMGKYQRSTVGNNIWENLSVIGHFRKAGVYNMASETTTFIRPRITNWSRDPSAFAYICDGFNYWNIPSTLCDPTVFPSGTGMSNTNNEYIAGDFRNMGGGSDIFLAKTSGHAFTRGCYYLAFGGSSFVLHTSSTFTHEDLTLLGHAETSATASLAGVNNSYYYPTPVSGLRYFINFVGDGTNSDINGLVIKGHAHQCNSSLINNETAGSIAIENFEFSSRDMAFAPRLFQGMTTSTISGMIQFSNSSITNLDGLSQFIGYVSSQGIPLSMRGVHIDTQDGTLSLSRTRSIGLDESQLVTVVSGNVDVESSFIAIEGGGQTITGFTKPAALQGQTLFVVRNTSSTGSITIQNSTTRIRTKDGLDYTISPLGSATFVFVTPDIIQQIA